MKKSPVLPFVLIFLIIIIVGYFFIFGNFKASNSINENSQNIPPVKITLDNFEEMLSQNQIIANLPSDARINLVLSNSTIEKDYILTRGNVSDGKAENPDIILSLPLKYLDNFTSQNFCDVIQNANNNKDLGVKTEISAAKLLIKYSSMMKYKSCLGM